MSTTARRKAIPGVRQVVVLDDLVAVVGDHMWAAKQGLDALDITWDAGPNGHVDSAQIWREIKAASEKPGLVAKKTGDADKALGSGDKFEAHYEMPFLAHATMEPMNCTVHLTPGACEVWLGTQIAARVQSTAAATAGLPLDKVIVHNQLIGGGFGRRLEPDMVVKAVRVAQHVDGPVKVVWTREEDIQHDLYRPVYYDRLAATLKDGKIDGWHHRVTGSSVVARWLPPAFTGNHNIDFDTVDSAIDIPYDIPNLRVEVVRCEPPAVPTGFWRGVGPNNNVFAIESFIDELAKKAGKDPVEFRRAMLTKTPRLLAALDLAAEKAGWGAPLPPRHGRGVSCQVSFASFIATVAHVEVEQGRRGPTAPPDHGGRHRHRRQSRHHRRAIAGRHDLRRDRRALRRDHDRQGPRAAVELPRLSHAAHQRGAAHRRASDQERRSRPAASARPARPPRRRRSATRSMPRPASRCGGCRSTARFWRGGNRHDLVQPPQRRDALCPRRRRGRRGCGLGLRYLAGQ